MATFKELTQQLKVQQGQKNPELKNLASEAQESREFLSKPWYKQIFSKEVKQELLPTTLNMLGGNLFKFYLSAKEIPEISKEAIGDLTAKSSVKDVFGSLGKAKATQREYRLPGTDTKYKSYISEAETTAGEVVEGKKGLESLIRPFVEVPLTGLEIMGLSKVVFGDVYLTGAKEIALNVPRWVSKGGKIVLERGAEAGQKVPGLITKPLEAVAEKIKTFKSKRDLEKTAQIVSDTKFKKASIESLKKSGQPGGAKISKIGTVKHEPSAFDFDVAAEVEASVPGWNSNKNPVRNLEKLNIAVDDIAQNQIRPFLKEQSTITKPLQAKLDAIALSREFAEQRMIFKPDLPDIEALSFFQREAGTQLQHYGFAEEGQKILNMNTLQAESFDDIARLMYDELGVFNKRTIIEQILALEPSAGVKSSTSSAKSFDAVKQIAIQEINNRVDDPLSLWDTRIALDTIMEKEFGPSFWDVNKTNYLGVKRGYDAVREIMNQSIANIPSGTKGYLGQIDKIFKLLVAQQNVAEKSWRIMNTNVINRLLQTQPWVKRVIPGIGGYFGAKKLLD